MRALGLIGLALATVAHTVAQAAPPAAKNNPDQIVCQLSGSCDGTTPDGSRKTPVGDEKAFSLARPGSTKVVTTTTTTKKRTTNTSTRPVAAKSSLDMQINFATGSADLSEQAKAEARAFAEAMKAPALAGMRFTVDGHTDAVGNRDYNLDLSKRRAQSVTDYLIAQGADPGRLEPQGYGFDKPRPGTAPTASANRRVEFSKQR